MTNINDLQEKGTALETGDAETLAQQLLDDLDAIPEASGGDDLGLSVKAVAQWSLGGLRAFDSTPRGVLKEMFAKDHETIEAWQDDLPPPVEEDSIDAYIEWWQMNLKNFHDELALIVEHLPSGEVPEPELHLRALLAEALAASIMAARPLGGLEDVVGET